MNKKRIRTILCVLLAAAGLTAFGALAAGGAGSKSDPLVTLSYLTDTFTAQIMGKVDAAIAQRNEQLLRELGGSGGTVSGAASSYTAVTLAAGQALYGEAGCEVLLRSGSASCAPGSAGLTDATTGGTLGGGGALKENHLYLMPESRSVSTAGGAVLLVRGTYTVGP